MKYLREWGRSDSKLVMACLIAWIVIGVFPAIFYCRFFYADGAYFFLQILEHQSIFFPAEGRVATYLLTQWPALLAIVAGCLDIRWLAWCFGAGLMLTPALIHGLSIFLLLRKGKTMQALIYVVMLWLLMGYSGLCVVSDSHISTAIFLLAIVLVTTFVQEKIGIWLALAVIGTLSFFLYEFWAFYSCSVLALLSWRLWPHWSNMSIRSRLMGLGTMFIFGLSITINTWRLLHSFNNPNQSSLLGMLIGTTYPVYLVLISSWFVGVCGHFLLETRYKGGGLSGILSGRLRRWILSVCFVLLAALCAIQHCTMIRYSYPFRTLNLILPLIYSCWMVMVARENVSRPVLFRARAFVVLLTIWLVANEIWMVDGWRNYQMWAGDVTYVAEGTFYVAQPPLTSMAKTWIFPWSHSAQSFLSQAVRSLPVTGIGYAPGAGWDPYGPGHQNQILSIVKKYRIKIQ
jgi:hypothetical protein